MDSRFAKNGFRTADEFVADVLRREREIEARKTVDDLLLKALDSGDAGPITPDYWNHIRREGRKLARQRHKK
ncbi:MAG TPA: hypothetical protein VGN88_10360 [Phycisphaerae bacterium]